VTVPQPMAADGQVAHDPVTASLLVKPKDTEGYARLFWRRGQRAMMQAAAGYGAPTVWAHSAGHRDLARGEPVRDGWLRFKLPDPVYRELVSEPGLSAIVTVDREAAQILGVRFLT
jgi:hypothetical protein